MSTTAPSVVTERMTAALRFDTGRSLVVLYGPGTRDEFIGHDFLVRRVEHELLEHLREAGFDRIVFSRVGLPIYFRDDNSREVSTLHRGPAAHVRRSAFDHFGNHCRLNVKERWEPDTKRRGVLVTNGADGSGNPPDQIDESAVRQLEYWMANTDRRTALVVVEAEDWFAHLDVRSNLATAISSWTQLGHGNRNCCILLFRASSIKDVSAFVEPLKHRVAALSAYLTPFLQNTRRARDAPISRLGEPEPAELDRLLQLMRLRHDLTVNWPEPRPSESQRRPLAEAMAVEQKLATQWLRWLYDPDNLDPVTRLDEAEFRRKNLLTSDRMGGGSARERLGQLIGLTTLKEHVEMLCATAADEAGRRRRGIIGEPPSLHLLFQGNPGTGKTEVARLIGELYREAGVLRRGHTHVVRVSDLVSQWVGHTPELMNEAIDRALDGVLFIDEAYRLTNEHADNHSKQTVDTLLDRMENERERLVVIVAGYRDEMKGFLASNPGLSSRIPEENRIDFPDFTSSELLTILLDFLRKRQITWTPETEEHLHQVIIGIHRDRRRGFGNAREMRSLADALRSRWAFRRHTQRLPIDEPLRMEDLPERYYVYLQREAPPLSVLLAELDGLVGLDSVKQIIKGTANGFDARMQRNRAALPGAQPIQPPIPPHLVFLGPPGTGKTRVAQLMARIYHAIGLLPTDVCVPVTPADLLGTHLGDAQANTVAAVDRALGGVLFIDEAHNLTPRSQQTDYGRAVIETLVPLLENRRGKLAVIVAGYGNEMERFLRSDPGLPGRFQKRVVFEPYTTPQLIEILKQMASEEGWELGPGVEERAAYALEVMREADPTTFDNARAVRRLLEEMEEGLGGRLGSLSREPDAAPVVRFEPDDVPLPATSRASRASTEL